jgi:Tfp pilus assembly protein PilO
MISRFSKQQLIAVGLAVGGLIVGLLGYVALVAPQKSHAKKLDSEIQTAHAQLLAAKHAPKVKGAAAGAADLFRLMKAMPDSDDVAGILIQLDQLAKASKVQLTSITPSVDVPGQGYGTVPIAVVVNGKYAGVTRFLRQLRGLVTMRNGRIDARGRLVVANQLAFAASDKGAVSATLNLNAFVYGLSAPAPTTSTDTTATGSGS